jgi:hypothetical protein
MASPPQGHGAAAPGAVVDPSCLDPEQQLTQVLAAFQAQVKPIAGTDLATVVPAGRPVFASGTRWGAQLLCHQGQRHLRVTLAHSSGAELCSEALADDHEDPLATAGRLLALLLGIPVATQARAAEPKSVDSTADGLERAGSGVDAAADPEHCPAPCPEPAPEPATAPEAKPGPAASSAPESAPAPSSVSPVAEHSRPLDPALLPLEAEAIQACHQRILALPAGTRRQLTAAFREHFQVPRSARSIGDRITQHRHLAFIELFLRECGSAEPQATAAEPAG